MKTLRAPAFSSTAILLSVLFTTSASCTQPKNPQVTFKTSMGNFTVELYPDKAPKTVENFLAYVKDGSYVGTIFHRVMKDFVVQGGGMDKNMDSIKTLPQIRNEADNGLKNDTGTVAMARTNDPHSASSQFFINLKENDFLNHREKSPSGWGYCVFGKVVDGMDVINAMAEAPTGNARGHQNVPKKAIVVKEVLLKDKGG